MKASLLYGVLDSLYNQFGNSILNIFSLLIIHSHDRTSSITRVHTRTWSYFTKSLADRFIHSPKELKEAIMTDINDLVQEFWTSSNGAVGTSFFAMRSSCLFGILQKCFESLVCFDIISFFATAFDFSNNNLQTSTTPYYSWRYRDQGLDDRISLRDKFKILFDGYRKMIDQSFSKSKDLGDMLRFLPGVVVQKNLSMQGMAALYGVKPDFLEHLIKSIELLRPSLSYLNPRYTLDDYLSGFLQDRDRSQLYFCDPELQHISICRQILSLLVLDRSNPSNVSDLQS